ncbi:MAG: hypothetical protein JWM68_5103, partial [Verrucomicrobiales bacterium]|nr:hypothetical protein [Verrucomicrobiales bacterium]
SLSVCRPRPNKAAGDSGSSRTRFMYVLIVLAPSIIVFLGVLVFMLPRRLRMERRARGILAERPDAEQTSVYLQFRSVRWSEKTKDHDAMVADMAAKGWTFLKASEASPARTIRSWAGGVNMHFIRL